MDRWLPNGARTILNRFHAAGYEAYVVGGCVRDALLGRNPHDWDICTSAFPDETLAVFSDCKVIKTGIQHGTVLLMLEDGGYEVTTFRTDGQYADHRHPMGVTFVRSLREDLARRDFTINAMAWSPETGYVDCFGGQDDLHRCLIRCVGEPERRFDEDGLRILRALRFAARYGYQLEPETAKALHQQAHLLKNISGERILVELQGILTSPAAEAILREYSDVFAVIIPELAPMFGHQQYNFHHCYDVWEHTLHAIGNVRPDFLLRFIMLLHDAGKPSCFTRDADGVGHFRGHPQVSAQIADDVMSRLHCDNHFREDVLLLIQWHDKVRIFTRKSLRRMLGALGAERSRLLFQVMKADAGAQSYETREAKLTGLAEGETLLETLIAENACCTVKDLAINGGDLIAAGEKPGKHMGEILSALLEAVIEEEVENERGALLERYRSIHNS